MGSFHADKVTIRVLPEVTIVFLRPRYIVVVPTTPPARPAVYFAIPFPRLGDYNGAWRWFRRQLWRQKNLTVEHCMRLASRYPVIEMGTARRVELEDKTVEVKHGGWSVIGNGGRIKNDLQNCSGRSAVLAQNNQPLEVMEISAAAKERE